MVPRKETSNRSRHLDPAGHEATAQHSSPLAQCIAGTVAVAVEVNAAVGVVTVTAAVTARRMWWASPWEETKHERLLSSLTLAAPLLQQ